MIWTFLKTVLTYFAMLIIPPPEAPFDPVIDVNEKCPGCGHRSGELRTVQDGTQQILVQHCCKICGARWHEKPILGAQAGVIIPAALYAPQSPLA